MYGGRTYSNSHHHHHHYPNHHHKGAPPSSGVALSPESALATDIFEQFIAASTFKSVLHHYRHMCDVLRLRPQNIRHFYPKLKNKIRSWKAQALWSKFDKRASHKCYNHGKACTNTKILIIGAGPCGLRSAIEAQLLGAKVVVVEKRDRFSRNNVLHLWPFVIADLKALGAKKFYGKFCAGAIDHISIRQLQCMLLKVALLLGVEVYEGVTFEELLEPPEDQSQLIGWHARFSPLEHPVNQYEFDVLIGADGKRNTLMGFKRKEFRGKLAIAITANFINKHTEQEARVQEISGVAFIFNQKFFKDLYAETGIDLENIVYYKDETHYFVMTAKKHSLIDKGVILRDLPDTQQLLHPNNVDRNALCEYAREAADFSTGYQMPHLDFAVNHYGKPDIAMFDFTSMFAAENACRVVERNGHKLLQCLVGDSLLEPFWPTGSGCARGFLSSFDACWALRSWSSGKMSPLEVVAERESIYRLLAQTTPENLSKDYSSYTLEPSSRYPTVNLKVLLAFQVRHLYITDEPEKVDVAPDDETLLESAEAEEDFPRKRKRRDSLIQPDTLLAWCQKQVAHNEDLNVEDLGSSFKDGRVLCTILHRYRPDLVDIDNLDPSNHTHNAQLAFDIFERDFGIPPVMTGAELANGESKDPPFLIGYIAQIHDALRGEIPHSMGSKPPLKVLKGQSLEDLDLEDFPDRPKDKEMEKIFFESNLSSSTSVSSVQTNGRLSCRILEEPKPESVLKEDLQKTKKRRNEFGSLDANAYERRLNLERNREDRLKKLKEQRELDTVRFVRSMRMLHCDVRDACTSLQPKVPSFRQQDDPSLVLYRKGTKSMREKAHELEKKLYSSDKMDEDPVGPKQRGLSDQSEDFSDRVKGLEAKFRGGSGSFSHHKPKDLIRAVGRLEKTDWNLSAIERKIEENPKPMTSTTDKERVPKWNRDNYKDKFQNIERRLRENGEDEERIAKYLDIDASLKRLERKLREGSTLETGLRGHNKVSDLAHQLSSKLVRKEDDTTLKTNAGSKQARAMVLPTSGSDLCYFCNTRVYLVERLSAEGKFFHRHCFKCSYCGALLRLGNYIYDRENRYGGKFFCIPHFGLTVRSRGSKKVEEMEQQKAAEMKALTGNIFSKGDADGGVSPLTRHDTDDRRDSTLIGGEPKRTPPHLTPPGKGALSLDRGTTPERVEFENSVIEYSDEEKYLSEDEWTDRNFGASANELDDDDDEDSDSYSDLSDEEVDEEALLVETSQNKLTADETRRLAESWKRRYSNDLLHMSDEDADESFSESENDDDLSEHGAEGDESHTPTEDEVGDDHDDDDDDGDDVRRARELRRLELNINVGAPPRKAETSDSGSETEVGSEEESDTQIDTDSEFADDRETSRIPKEIPTIVIDEMPKEGKEEVPDLLLEPQEKERSSKEVVLPLGSVVPEQYVSQAVDMSSENEKDRAERSVSMSNIPRQGNTSPSNPRTEQLKRLLQRTESTEVVSAQRNYLRRQYLLGNNSYSPRKSVSTADLGNRFKSFMDKISETQKKLNPAPQPSPAMQAFLNMSNKNVSITSPTVSPSRHSPSNYLNDSKELTPTTLPITDDNLLCEKDSVFTKSRSGESSDSSSKSEEGKLITFPSRLDGDLSPKKESSSSSSVSAYDNVASTKKESIAVPCLEEKGALDSEQSERSNLEKHLENAIGTELCPDNDTVALIEAFNTPCLDESQNPVEALNMEIISTENMKNAAIVGESQLEELDDFSKNSSRPVDDDNVEEVFDQLANDALIEFNRSNSATSLHILEEAFLVKEEHEGEKEAKDNITPAVHILDSNFNLKNDNSQQQNVASEKKQDESGFKSMEETKSSSSSGKNLVKPLVETTQNDVSEGAALTNANQSDVISPDAEAVTTEADLSDWADDNETFGINADDFEAEFSLCKGANTTPPSASRVLSSTRPSESSGAMKPIARIASLESLGDSDSAISISNGKAQPVAHTKPSPFAELETMEFMDSSGSDSSQEDIPSVCISYNQLQDCTPTSPSPPPNEELVSNPVLPRPSEPLQDSKRDITAVKSKSVDKEDTLNQVVPPRSSSEPPSLKEPTPAICHDSSSETEDSPDDYSSHSKLSSPQGVYEGYIPRFKDRKVPFNLARDSIDVRKSSSSKPLFTPSRDDVLQREKNESDRSAVKNDPLSFSLLSSPTTDSPQETPSPVSSVAHSYGRNAKAKDGDLVREMVMSRISKNGEARTPRRGSRNALHLSLHSSSSSLFSSEPSLLLDTSAATNKSSSPTFSPEEKKSVSTATNPTVTSQEHDSRGDVIAQAPPPPTSVKLASTENVVPFKEQRSEDIPSPSDLGSSKLSLSFHKMAMNSSPIPKQCDYSTRNVLPATPLTHPERFQREDAVKRELFKSSPQLHFPPPTSQQTQTTSYPPLATGSSQVTYSSSIHAAAPNLNKSLELPLLVDQNVNLSKSLVNNYSTKESPVPERVRRLSETETKRESGERERPQSLRRSEVGEKPSRKDPDERLKELLEERRRKDASEQREVRLRKKDSCLQECLEEYRQKRSSAPVFTQTSTAVSCPSVALELKMKGDSSPHTRAQLGLAPHRQFHRPSILELESMQIFSSPTRSVRESTTPPSATTGVTSTPVGSVTSANPAPSSIAPPFSILTPSPPSSKDSSFSKPPSSPGKDQPDGLEKKSVKRSKDRERRRSLIQVVAGMFSKSDEKKKEDGETEAKSSTSEKSSLPLVTPTGSIPPKSPSVKERFSKLRLSRTKEKKKSSSDGKNRSASVDNPAATGTSKGKDSSHPMSLPTTPSRTIFSFLSSSPVKPFESKSKSSASGSSTSYFGQRFSPSCIKEENNSDDESTQMEVAPPIKDSPPSMSTPSLRRQKAALRVAKQAEQKRLRMAQEIQRQLEECDVKMRDLEERGIGVEKALIGETEGTARDETELMKDWFCLVHEKNALVRWQEELTVKARELELEDRHVRLENELRQRMTSAEREKTREDIEREGKILAEIISIIEQKDALVNLLEEDRQRYVEEDRDLELLHARKILQRPAFERETGV